MHQDEGRLSQQLEMAQAQIRVGARYRHYRQPDKIYVVIGIGILEASEEPAIIYQAEYGHRLVWIRSVIDFMSEVEVNGELYRRFELMSDPDTLLT